MPLWPDESALPFLSYKATLFIPGNVQQEGAQSENTFRPLAM